VNCGKAKFIPIDSKTTANNIPNATLR